MNRSVIALLAVLLCGACNRAPDPPPAAPATAPAPAPASVSAATRPVPEPAFVASGPLVVENQVDVAAQRDGVIARVLAEPGTHVRRGQLLALLDDRQITADYEAAAARSRAVAANIENWKAEEKALQVDYDRADKLYKAEIIPKEQLDHTKYKQEADEYEIKRETETLANAQQTQKSLALERDKTRIVAPFDGMVARRYIHPGQKVAVGDRLFWVTALGPLEVRFTLPERWLSRVSVGEQLSLSTDDVSPHTEYSARVAQVSPVVDPSSGTVEVLARVQGDTSGLRPGMLVNITLPNQP